MITFKQFLMDSDESTVRMIAGMYRNLDINVQEVTVIHTKSRYNRMKNCFYNSEMLVKKGKAPIYVLGFVIVHGVPLEHAWIKNTAGEYFDPTINVPEQYTYYSCFELSHDELLAQIARIKTQPGYIDLATLNRYSKK